MGQVKYNKSEGRTLFQILCEKTKNLYYRIKHYFVDFNYEIDSPLPIKISSYISIRTPDFVNYNFKVEKISENTHDFGDKFIKSYDYDLIAKALNQPDYHLKVRLIPDKKSKNDIKYQALVLTLYYEQSYHEDFHQVLKDMTGKFIVTDDKDDDDPSNDTEETFRRMGSLSEPYQIESIIIEDSDGNKKVSENEVEKANIEYYDYYLKTKDRTEFLFVEMNKDTGWFKIWRGTEIFPEKIMIL